MPFSIVSFTTHTAFNSTARACEKLKSKQVTKAPKTDNQTSGLAAAKQGWPEAPECAGYIKNDLIAYYNANSLEFA
tara:strand:- start:73 stop:300 length:228 start_codon:yes stop_codon:yes gene_type:complete